MVKETGLGATLSDSLLLEQLGQGRSSRDGAFEEIFARYRHLVYGVLFRMTGDRDEAEELSQEVFLKLYTHRFRSGESHNLQGWLYRVATNLGFNSLRSRQRQRNRLDRLAHERPEHGSGSDPGVEVLRQEERDAVRQILATLPERQAACLTLRQMGLSYAEIAQAVGVSPGSVGTLLARAECTFKERYLSNDKEANYGMR
ncbi:MAG: sigma-70 family RNA polymerase sigma factor [Chloroflexi bacterium]|nr:sigma-70 family RNA polymerase sigma factor [Chloroflexota bacterium]